MELQFLDTTPPQSLNLDTSDSRNIEHNKNNYDSSVGSDVDFNFNDDEEAWSDWEVSENDQQPIECLFCSKEEFRTDLILNHMIINHDFDIVKLKSELKLEFYKIMRLLNYLRQQKREGVDLTGFKVNLTDSYLTDDTYLLPTYQDDRLLYDLDDLADLDNSTFSGATSLASSYASQISVNAFSNYNKERVKMMKKDIKKLAAQLNQVQNQFHEYKLFVKEQFFDNLSTNPVSSTTSDVKNKGEGKETGVELEVNKPYFESYAGLEIHEQMLKDKVRTEAYRDFILNNPSLFKDKVVLDVGCGTGILSMFAAKAGAKQVIAVDNSDIVYQTMDIVNRNNFGSIITVLKGKIEQVKLPVDKVDIIISEWMGYCLLFEAMFDSVIYARDTYLQPDGLLVPNYSQILIATVSDSDWVEKYVQFWDDVYGFDMSNLNVELYKEAQITILKPDSITSTPQSILDLELNSIKVAQLDFESNINLTIQDNRPIHGLVIYFDTLFTSGKEDYLDWITAYNLGIAPSETSILQAKVDEIVVFDQEPKNESGDLVKYNNVAFSTGPNAIPTHWKQTFLLLPKPLLLEKGYQLNGKVKVEKDFNNFRGLKITLNLYEHLEKELTYKLI